MILKDLSPLKIEIPEFYLRKNGKRPKITWSVLSKAFLCGLFGGSLYLNLYLEALALTSATFMLAVVNLIPAITFIMAVTSGLDKLNLGVAAGRAKAKLNQEYPSPHSSAALMSTMGAIQATVIALCVDRDWSQWKLNNNIRLLTVIYPGIVVSGLVVMVIACVLGSVMIVCGLYAVLWGQGKEMKNKKTQLVPLEITKESENVELVVVSTLVDNAKDAKETEDVT
ncbi:putative WAT1-related protein [Sesbania bispinosa]|nr:putative WAT1-related protein [Sesbania bispinosa]